MNPTIAFKPVTRSTSAGADMERRGLRSSRTRRAAYVAFHNVGTAAGVFGGAMLGALLEVVLPPRGVLFGDSTVLSSLLYLFIISGIARAFVAALLARRVRELRKPRRALSAPALVLRVTGLNAMVGFIYDFIGRPATDGEDRDDSASARPEAAAQKKGDNGA